MPRPVLDRVANHAVIDEETGCHLWTAYLDDRGRPTTHTGSLVDGTRRMQRVHRVVWIEHNGEPPEGFVVHHRCGEIHCVNIDHLELMRHDEHSAYHGGNPNMGNGYSLHVRWHVNREIAKDDCPYC